MAHLLGAEALRLEYPTKRVLDAVTLGVNEGDRVGIVGRNGDGKSTLLNLLAGRMEPDGGKVTRRRGVDIGMVDQADALDKKQTVAEAIVGDLEEYIWASDARIRDVIDGLVSELPWDAPLSSLSGGQRRRVALAAVLVKDHDIIFLDEPTNHLDVEGITWLAGHLKSRWAPNEGGLVVVTHDRWFLDEVCTVTWEVHDAIVDSFEGGYAAYILQRVERDRQASVGEQKRQNLMRKELAWLRRGPPARTSKPKFRIDAANALIAEEPPARNTVELQSMAMTRLGKDVVDLLDVSVSFGDKQVLREIEWRIAPGERTGILGVNGAGKSTLLNLITGALKPTTGTVKRGQTINVATLTQLSHGLDEVGNERVRDVLAKKRTSFVVGGKEVTSSQLFERLGFSSTHLQSFVKELSGGQKRRLQLLLILLDEPNVLVMDEPSNDLDTDMLAAMEDLLDSFAGTLIVVSHDRYLMERVTDQQYAVMDGRLRHLPGGVEQYVNLRKSSAATSAASTNNSKSGASSGPTKPGLSNIEQRAAQKEMTSIERKLQKLPGQQKQAKERIAAHDQSDYVGLGELAQTLNDLTAKQSTLEERWLELSDAME